MKHLKNESGYALVSVLLIIVVFMIVFLVFMGRAFSSGKENVIVEKSAQSTSIAEMGVSYYQVAVQNIFESDQQAVNTQVNAQINGGSTTDFKTLATSAMKDAIKQDLLKEPQTVQVNGTRAYFSIRNIDTSIISGTNTVKVNFSVDGTEDGKMSTLNADMTIDLSSLIQGATTFNYVLPAFNEVKIPSNGCLTFDNGCSNVLLTSQNSTDQIAFPGTNGNSSNSNNLSDKVLYSQGPGTLTVNGNANNSYHVQIHADGDVNTDGNMNHASKLTIETSGNMTINGNFKIEDSSRILIKNSLTVIQKQLDLYNSFIFVGKDASIDNLDLNNSSTMCVQGNLTVNSQSVDSTSNLIVYGKINGTATNITQSQFESKCGTVASQNLTINWGQSILTKIDNVNYNK